MKRICLITHIVILLLCSHALAHDWWLNKSNSNFDIVKGHIEADGVHCDLYEPDRAIQAAGYRDDGQVLPITITWKKDGSGSYIESAEQFCALTALVYNKYWMKTTKGWKNYRSWGEFEIIKEGQSYKYTKHIQDWHGCLAKPLGQRFEIVPLKDPTKMNEGDFLPLKIFFMGKEIQSAKITKISKTHDLESINGDGVFNVRIGPTGFQFFNAKIEIPVKDKEIIWYAASLTFYTTR